MDLEKIVQNKLMIFVLLFLFFPLPHQRKQKLRDGEGCVILDIQRERHFISRILPFASPKKTKN